MVRLTKVHSQQLARYRFREVGDGVDTLICDRCDSAKTGLSKAGPSPHPLCRLEGLARHSGKCIRLASRITAEHVDHNAR
jgi:hypothetical protein